MYYSFAAYEQDFRGWWESREYPVDHVTGRSI